VVALGDNLSLAMKSPSIRVVPVPEKSAVGVEVPNVQSSMVGLRGILASHDFQNTPSLLSLALGKTTDGCPYVTDLMPMPHLLIAGATGSGKSVCIHSLILSILYRARPDEVKFLLIDPKRLEMPIYRGLPHIYDPRVSAEKADIITQPKEAAESLKKLVRVMEKRYERFAQETVRNIAAYNEKMAQTGGQKEFYIVVIIDELADLMLIATKEVEDSIQRLAQMARAVGIHLVLATQRPSVDVITGVIKANFPARIAFQTTSKVDSRVILDAIGADALLGKGDMLFVPPGESRPTRLQGAFVSAKEAEQVVKFIQQQNAPRQYEDLFVRAPGEEMDKEDAEDKEELSQALRLVLERKRVSQDLLKAHFGSSARATNLLSLLETKGFIHKPEGTNRWTIYFDKIGDYLNRETPPAN
jgi:S-DNA-T family DNA segregation ATPase FtsK/SpoIIIE